MRLLLTAAAAAISCAPVSAQDVLPANMYADEAHAPFLWGVASGDPLPDGIVLWTRIDPSVSGGAQQAVQWEIAESEGFGTVLASGTVQAAPAADHCVRVEVGGLSPDRYYWYRFRAPDGSHSAIGRTRTAPQGSTPLLRFAVASCSSIYSGFFNAYRRIAELDNLNLVIHLGDYIYDFVDQDEQVRIPSPFPTDPQDLEGWRDRHRYYLLDPDLRAARQMHPWMAIWDNHDYDRNHEGGIQAFFEYVPRRDTHSDIEKAHRSLSFGDLADVTLIDIQKFRNIDEVAPDQPSVLSNSQRQWFLSTLAASTARWRITGNQKMFGGWYTGNISLLNILPIPNDGEVFDAGSWDGFMAERDTVLRFIEENGINNFMVISGDVHMSFAMDLSRDPLNAEAYNATTGAGSLGVEFIPTSISRGNFDESGVPSFLVPAFETASSAINRHHRFTEFVQHGYGLLIIRPDSIEAEWRYSPILQQSSNESIARRMTVLNGHNKWKRPGDIYVPPSSVAEAAPGRARIYPNPASTVLHIDLASGNGAQLRIMDSSGRLVHSSKLKGSANSVDITALAPGNYTVSVESGTERTVRPMVVAR